MLEQTAGLAILAIFPICMIFATFYDIFTMTIPNKIVLVLLAGFLVLAPIAGMSVETSLWHVGLAVVILVVGFALFSMGVMGGGDAKLLAVSALWLGPEQTVVYLLIASLLGGLLTLIIMRGRRMLLPQSLLGVPWITRLHDSTQGVPYGAALGPAALYVFPDTVWMTFATGGGLIG
ncbi:MAG: prepilin peptidase [Pseudomonadota bacterium]